jgi:hypothetical protein
MPDLEDRLSRALREGDALDKVSRAAAAPAPTIKVNDELSLAASALATLAEAHVRKYTNQLEEHRAGARGIRPEECEDLIAVWEETARRIANGMALETRGAQELEDALDCGDYDYALTPAELAVVRRWRGFH